MSFERSLYLVAKKIDRLECSFTMFIRKIVKRNSAVSQHLPYCESAFFA